MDQPMTRCVKVYVTISGSVSVQNVLICLLKPVLERRVIVDADITVAETVPIRQKLHIVSKPSFDFFQELLMRHPWTDADGNQLTSETIKYFDLYESCIGIRRRYWRVVRVGGRSRTA